MKLQQTPLSQAQIARLPRYYRCIRELIGADILKISSAGLANIMGLTASQVRQDLSRFGPFGQQGYGYNLKDLYSGIGEVLGVNNGYTAVLVGTGNFALICRPAFLMRGITLKAVFSDECTTEGSERETDYERLYPLNMLGEYLKNNKINILALACSKAIIRESVRLALEYGLSGIWNLTGEDLNANIQKIMQEIGCEKNIAVRDVNLSDSLMSLCCEINLTGNTAEGSMKYGGDET